MNHNLLADPARSVVVVIDLQGKLMDMVWRPELVLRATDRLMRLAEIYEVPVLLTEQYPEGLGPTHPDIRATYDALATPKRELQKLSFGCCGEDGFEELLETMLPGVAPDRRQIVVAGIEAHICVVQTVLELLRQGSSVYLCAECVSSRGAGFRHWALRRMEQAGCVLTNHESVGFEWARDKDASAFKPMSRLFRGEQIGGDEI